MGPHNDAAEKGKERSQHAQEFNSLKPRLARAYSSSVSLELPTPEYDRTPLHPSVSKNSAT